MVVRVGVLRIGWVGIGTPVGCDTPYVVPLPLPIRLVSPQLGQ